MDGWNVLTLAMGVAMDAVAVTVAKSICKRDFTWFDGFLMASWFGFFQAGMTWLGWLIGSHFEWAIVQYDHWVAFGLLCFLGGKMMMESFEPVEEDCDQQLDWRTLLVLAIATSVDAMAVGLSFAFLSVSISRPVAWIGLVTFLFCLVAGHLGHAWGAFLEKRANLIGGLMLILIGSKILMEHLLA